MMKELLLWNTSGLIIVVGLLFHFGSEPKVKHIEDYSFGPEVQGFCLDESCEDGAELPKP